MSDLTQPHTTNGHIALNPDLPWREDLAYGKGVTAYRRRKPRGACPYHTETAIQHANRRAWLMGWDATAKADSPPAPRSVPLSAGHSVDPPPMPAAPKMPKPEPVAVEPWV